MTETSIPSEPSRGLPNRREGAPPAGQSRRRYLRWKRAATIAMSLLLIGFAVALVSFFRGANEDEGVRATRALLRDLAEALDAHHQRVGELPAKIAELVHPSSPYRGSPIPEDAYGGIIEYRVVDSAAGTWRLRSAGPDQQPGTPDDIVWPEGTTWD